MYIFEKIKSFLLSDFNLFFLIEFYFQKMIRQKIILKNSKLKLQNLQHIKIRVQKKFG